MKIFGLTVIAVIFTVAAFAQEGANDPQNNPQGAAGTETTAPAQQQDQMGGQNQQQVAPDQGQSAAQGGQGAQGTQNQNNPQGSTATTY